MLRIHYSRPTTPAGPGFDDELTNVVQVGSLTGLVTSAQLGEAATCSIVLDDPGGTLGHASDAIVGLRRMYIVEDSAPAGDTVVWDGYVGVREYRRGEAAGITPLGAGRQVTVELVDDNAIAKFRIITGIDGNRPAESAEARLHWILGSAYANTIVDDGLVVYPSTAMSAADYRGQTPADVFADLAAVTGYNWWCQYNQATGHIQLWFDDPNLSTSFSSTLQISNVQADVDNSTTFAPKLDAVLRRDPSRVAAGVYLPYPKGKVYVTNYDTSYAFGFRDHAAPMGNVATEDKALAAANRFLADNNAEDDRITCTVRLPASKLTAIKAGHRLQVKFSHLPDYGSYRWCRVVRRTVTQAPLTDQFYDVALDLSPAGSSAHFLLAVQSSADGAHQDLSTNGWTRLLWNQNIGGASVIACGAGPPQGQGNSVWYRAIVPGESATVATFKLSATDRGGMWVYEIAGGDIATLSSINTRQFLADGGTASVSMTAIVQSVLFGVVSFAKVSYDGGWCSTSRSDAWGPGGTPGALVIASAGTELVNKSSVNGCGALEVPWTWIAYAQGTGTLSVSAVANSHGDGANAYICGYNIGRAGVMIPLVGPFRIVQSAFGGSSTQGAVYTVTLPTAPTVSG